MILVEGLENCLQAGMAPRLRGLTKKQETLVHRMHITQKVREAFYKKARWGPENKKGTIAQLVIKRDDFSNVWCTWLVYKESDSPATVVVPGFIKLLMTRKSKTSKF